MYVLLYTQQFDTIIVIIVIFFVDNNRIAFFGHRPTLARGGCQGNRSILKPVFRRFRPIHCAYVSLRCLHLEIWRFLCRQTTTADKTDCFTPCACVRGNKERDGWQGIINIEWCIHANSRG